jgi:hypothetical protein
MNSDTKADERNRPHPGTPDAHWAHVNPVGQPARENVIGLPRLVLETRAHLGPAATPEEVATRLREQGVETDVDAIREVWDEGHAD